MNENLTDMQKGIVVIGFILLLSSTSPMDVISVIVSRILCFGSFGTNLLIYKLLPFLLQLLISSIIIWVLFVKMDVFERISSEYYSFYLLFFGSVIYFLASLGFIFPYYLSPSIYHIVSHISVQYASYVGIAFLYVGCTKILIGIHPE